MAEVFQRAALNFGGAFAADQGTITFAGEPDSGLTPVLVQNLTIDYRQQVTRLYELSDGSTPPSVYQVGGRSQGSLGIARVIGPRVLLDQFYSTYGDVCNMPNNSLLLTLNQGCADEQVFLRYYVKYCLLTRVGVGISAQELVANADAQLDFTVLDHVAVSTVVAGSG